MIFWALLAFPVFYFEKNLETFDKVEIVQKFNHLYDPVDIFLYLFYDLTAYISDALSSVGIFE